MPDQTLPPHSLLLTQIARAIPNLGRSDLEALTERLIDRLDELEDDPDLEEDDPSGQCDEDGINTWDVVRTWGCPRPGCDISDPGI